MGSCLLNKTINHDFTTENCFNNFFYTKPVTGPGLNLIQSFNFHISFFLNILIFSMSSWLKAYLWYSIYTHCTSFTIPKCFTIWLIIVTTHLQSFYRGVTIGVISISFLLQLPTKVNTTIEKLLYMSHHEQHFHFFSSSSFTWIK